MRKWLGAIVLTVVLMGCGDKQRAEAPPAATPAEREAEHDLEGYSQGVKDYYGRPHTHEEDEGGGGFGQDSEEEYHQPPMPAEAGEGETITLTGTNLGIRLRVTVTGVERVTVGSRRYTAVELKLENTGPSVFEDSFRQAVVDYDGGRQAHVVLGRRAKCSRGFEGVMRITDQAPARGCLLFELPGSATPERFRLALEQVPVTAGGIWNLG